MLAPSGDQFEIAAGGYRAVVTEGGGALRVLEHAGVALIDGFGEDEMSPGGRGQLLMPWPNRIRDGAYSFGGRDLQLALTEPSKHNASHGLVRWAAWSLEEHSAASVSLVLRVPAQTGYPWTLDLQVLYDLSADGLTVTQTATNMSSEPAPYASGAHPYLRVGPGPVDGLELTLPAATRSLVDDRLLPVGREDVEGTSYDFRVARPIRGTALDAAFTDLDRDADGVATTTLRDPSTGARGRAVGRPAPPLAAALHRRRLPGAPARVAGRGADDGPRRRVPQRRGPRHAGAGGRARRRALRLLGRARAGVTGRRPGGRRRRPRAVVPGVRVEAVPRAIRCGRFSRAIQFRATGSPDRHRSGEPAAGQGRRTT